MEIKTKYNIDDKITIKNEDGTGVEGIIIEIHILCLRNIRITYIEYLVSVPGRSNIYYKESELIKVY